MGSLKIKHTVREARRLQKRAHDRLRAPNPKFVTIVQDEHTKQVLGVLVDRNAFDRFRNNVTLNLDHAELIDIALTN